MLFLALLSLDSRFEQRGHRKQRAWLIDAIHNHTLILPSAGSERCQEDGCLQEATERAEAGALGVQGEDPIQKQVSCDWCSVKPL